MSKQDNVKLRIALRAVSVIVFVMPAVMAFSQTLDSTTSSRDEFNRILEDYDGIKYSRIYMDIYSLADKGSYVWAVNEVGRLSSLQKLSAEIKKDHDTLLPIIINAYKETLVDWPKALYGSEGVGGVSSSFPYLNLEPIMKDAVITTYLMGESGDPECIKVLLDGYNKQQLQIMISSSHVVHRQSPVLPAFTLYALHRLILTLDEDSIDSTTGKAVRQMYLKWADSFVPSLETLMVEGETSSDDRPSTALVVSDGTSTANKSGLYKWIGYPVDEFYTNLLSLSEVLTPLGEGWGELLLITANELGVE